MWAKKLVCFKKNINETNFRQTICFPNIFFVPKKVLDNKKCSVKKNAFANRICQAIFFLSQKFMSAEKTISEKKFLWNLFCWRHWHIWRRRQRLLRRLAPLAVPWAPSSALLPPSASVGAVAAVGAPLKGSTLGRSGPKGGNGPNKKLHWEGTNKNVNTHCEYQKESAQEPIL